MADVAAPAAALPPAAVAESRLESAKRAPVQAQFGCSDELLEDAVVVAVAAAAAAAVVAICDLLQQVLQPREPREPQEPLAALLL